MAGLLICAACSSGDKGTGPATVASVTLNLANTVIAVGGTTTFTANVLDASGNSLSGQTVTWSSSAAAIATVSGGVVTGVSAGATFITAAVGNKTATQTVTVTAITSTSCTAATTLSLAVGAVHVLTDAEKASLCVSGGTAGSEYVLVPFKGDASSNLTPVSITSIGTLAATGAPTAAASASASAQLIPALSRNARLKNTALHGAFGAAFERHLRTMEREQLTPIVNATPRGALVANMQRSLRRSGILNLASTPALGTYFPLNSNGDSACNARVNHTARIAAVSNAAIIAVDSLAPANGFTDAEYASIAATFDTLIFALDTSAFGAPADLDNNGRVLIFFTQAVNQLTPAGSNGFIGGFFFARDLFPVATQSTLLQACPASNQGEMFYVPVLDITSKFNGFFADKTQFKLDLISTLAHEFQHLINASRRLYVTQTANWDEDVWLNEGMSHIAEELLYFRESGFAPKQFLTLAKVAQPAVVDAINNYQLQNLLRLDDYLFAPGINSPYAQNDSLETRGATYELLRYAMDMSTGTNSSYLHALINTQQTGTANFNAVFGATFTNIFTAVQQQVLANFFNGSGIAIDPKYSFPSWNYRDVIGNGLDSPADNPLSTKQLTGAGAVTFSLTGGGAGYGRFRIIGNGTANITSASGSGVVPTNVTMILVRTL
jgi:Bacterial Ig-like domain (group 2)